MSNPSNINIFLIRGLARESAHWGELRDKLSEVNFICLDIPGAGEHHSKKCPYIMKNIVKEMRKDYLKALSTNPSKHNVVLAVSLGGMIATKWITDYPDDFQKAVVVNTSFKKLSSPFKRLKLKAMLQLGRVISAQNSFEREWQVLKLISNREDLRNVTAEKWSRISEERPVSFSNFLRQIISASIFSLPKEKPKTPILVLCSEQDQMVNPVCSKKFAKHWELPIEIHPTAGHDLALDDPEWMIEKIVSF